MKKPQRYGWKYPLLVLAMMALAIYTGSLAEEKRQRDHKPRPQVVSEADPRAYSETDLKAFWTNELDELVGKQLVSGGLPYPIINDSFGRLNKATRDRSGYPIAFNMIPEYCAENKEVEAATGLIGTNAQIHISLFIPALLDSFDMYRASGNPHWHEDFQTHTIAVIMHEMEHAAGGSPVTRSINVAEESRAWAETCKNTLVPLRKTYGLRLTETEEKICNAWESSFGNTNALDWRLMLDHIYGSFDGKKVGG